MEKQLVVNTYFFAFTLDSFILMLTTMSFLLYEYPNSDCPTIFFIMVLPIIFASWTFKGLSATYPVSMFIRWIQSLKGFLSVTNLNIFIASVWSFFIHVDRNALCWLLVSNDIPEFGKIWKHHIQSSQLKVRCLSYKRQFQEDYQARLLWNTFTLSSFN